MAKGRHRRGRVQTSDRDHRSTMTDAAGTAPGEARTTTEETGTAPAEARTAPEVVDPEWLEAAEGRAESKNSDRPEVGGPGVHIEDESS